MKGLVRYIRESNDVTKVKELTVTYKAVHNPVIIETSNDMSEDDMMIYLDDMCIDKMVSKTDDFKKVMGDNYNDITDAYFEYSKYTVEKTASGDIDVEWDAKVGGNRSNEMWYYKLDDLKYIIKFTEFNMQNTDDDIDGKLEDIFKTFNSGQTNSYPISIELENIEHE